MGTAAGPLGEARSGGVRDLACLLKQSVEQKAPGSGPSSVEPEGELVEVVGELRDRDATLVGTE